MVGTEGATPLLMATMTTAWLATRLTAAHLAWSGGEAVLEVVATAATGVEPLTPLTQRSR